MLGECHRLAVFVSYSSNERMFVDAIITSARKFADAVVLAVGDRLYDGNREDDTHISTIAERYPDVHIAQYMVKDELLNTPVALHNSARIACMRMTRHVFGSGDFWVLLLDGDEVPDGDRMAAWWRGVTLEHAAYKMANYWYFMSTRLRADALEDSVLLVHSSLLTDQALSHPRERDGVLMHHGIEGRTPRETLSLDGKPMFHHFSWVRADRRALYAKVRNWGHSRERPWGQLIDQFMDQIEAGKTPTHDFVHGYRLTVVEADDSVV